MTTETLTALQDSIRHWHRLATGTQGPNEAPTANNCALCSLFKDGDGGAYVCEGCPVLSQTTLTGCRGTPYDRAFQAWRNYSLTLLDGSALAEHLTFRRAAAKELAFLLDLLPAEARPAMDAELAALSGTCHICGLWAMHPESFVQKDGLVCAACA